MKQLILFLLMIPVISLGQVTKLGRAADTPPTFSISDAAASESDGYITFTIIKSSQKTFDPSDLTFTTSDSSAVAGSDYADTTISLTFAKNEYSKTVQVRIINDAVVENEEYFYGSISVLTNGRLWRGTGKGYITDDDTIATPPLGTSYVYVNASGSGATLTEGSTYTFNITRTGELNQESTVDWAVTGSGSDPANATDFTGAVLPSGTVTFAVGDSSKTVTFSTTDDATVENDEGFTLTLSNPVTCTIQTATADGIILNNDSPPPVGTAYVGLSDSLPISKAEGSTYTFTVTRTGETTVACSAAWAVTGSGAAPANSTDFGGTSPSGTVSFAAGETSKTITFSTTDDSDVEPDEGFTLTLSNPTTCQLIKTTITGVITNNDNTASLPYSAFTLDAPATVSAGVYNGDTLIRTLFSNRRFESGTHIVSWDGKRDDGTYDSVGKTIRILTNNVQYEWLGVVGNNSAYSTGDKVIRGFDFIQDFTIAGGKIFLAKGYEEGQPGNSALLTTNPYENIELLGYGSTDDIGLVCTDGTTNYWEVYDAFGSTGKQFIFASKVADNAFVGFSSGTSQSVVYGRTYNSAIDVVNNTAGRQSGLAVQRTGSYLFVAHKTLNQIHVLNKTSGALVQTVSFTAPERLAIDGDGYLWVVNSGNVTRHTINADGTINTTPSVTLSGLVEPLSVAANGSNVYVCDGGTSQQVEVYTNSGTSLWTLGTAGGYNNSPAVTNTKFYFNDGRFYDKRKPYATGMTFDTDGSFWLLDPGNSRMLHFSASRTYIEQVMYRPHSYSCTVDPGDPSRVFSDWLEFQIDYTKPFGTNTGFWTLKNNWGYNVTTDMEWQYGRLNRATTLSNGRTYAQPGGILVELTATGVRSIGALPSGYELFDDGSLRSVRGGYGQIQSFYKRVLTGFDGSGNPQWGTETLVAATAETAKTNPILGATMTRPFYQTVSGAVVSYQGNIGTYGGSGYHIGALKGGTWLWKTMYNTRTDYQGEFPGDHFFEGGNSVRGAGDLVRLMGRNIFAHFYGEFWKGSQTNKFYQFNDDGLMVGQFGSTGWDSTINAPFGHAGNAFSWHIANKGDSAFIFHNDESHHSGIGVYKITKLNTVSETTVEAKVYTEAVDYTDLLAGVPNYSAFVDGNGWINYPATDNLVSGSYWEGKTGVKAYNDTVDLYTRFSAYTTTSPKGYYYRERTITPPAATSWQLSMDVSWDKTMPNTGDYPQGIGNEIRLLDGSGKVIARVNTRSNFSASPYQYGVQANGTYLVNGSTVRRPYIEHIKPLTITRNGGSTVTINYAGYSATLPFADVTSSGTPATLQIRFWGATGTTLYTQFIDLKNIHFKELAP